MPAPYTDVVAPARKERGDRQMGLGYWESVAQLRGVCFRLVEVAGQDTRPCGSRTVRAKKPIVEAAFE